MAIDPRMAAAMLAAAYQNRIQGNPNNALAQMAAAFGLGPELNAMTPQQPSSNPFAEANKPPTSTSGAPIGPTGSPFQRGGMYITDVQRDNNGYSFTVVSDNPLGLRDADPYADRPTIQGSRDMRFGLGADGNTVRGVRYFTKNPKGTFSLARPVGGSVDYLDIDLTNPDSPAIRSHNGSTNIQYQQLPQHAPKFDAPSATPKSIDEQTEWLRKGPNPFNIPPEPARPSNIEAHLVQWATGELGKGRDRLEVQKEAWRNFGPQIIDYINKGGESPIVKQAYQFGVDQMGYKPETPPPTKKPPPPTEKPPLPDAEGGGGNLDWRDPQLLPEIPGGFRDRPPNSFPQLFGANDSPHTPNPWLQGMFGFGDKRPREPINWNGGVPWGDFRLPPGWQPPPPPGTNEYGQTKADSIAGMIGGARIPYPVSPRPFDPQGGYDWKTAQKLQKRVGEPGSLPPGAEVDPDWQSKIAGLGKPGSPLDKSKWKTAQSGLGSHQQDTQDYPGTPPFNPGTTGGPFDPVLRPPYGNPFGQIGFKDILPYVTPFLDPNDTGIVGGDPKGRPVAGAPEIEGFLSRIPPSMFAQAGPVDEAMQRLILSNMFIPGAGVGDFMSALAGFTGGGPGMDLGNALLQRSMQTTAGSPGGELHNLIFGGDRLNPETNKMERYGGLQDAYSHIMNQGMFDKNNLGFGETVGVLQGGVDPRTGKEFGGVTDALSHLLNRGMFPVDEYNNPILGTQFANILSGGTRYNPQTRQSERYGGLQDALSHILNQGIMPQTEKGVPILGGQFADIFSGGSSYGGLQDAYRHLVNQGTMPFDEKTGLPTYLGGGLSNLFSRTRINPVTGESEQYGGIQGAYNNLIDQGAFPRDPTTGLPINIGGNFQDAFAGGMQQVQNPQTGQMEWQRYGGVQDALRHILNQGLPGQQGIERLIPQQQQFGQDQQMQAAQTAAQLGANPLNAFAVQASVNLLGGLGPTSVTPQVPTPQVPLPQSVSQLGQVAGRINPPSIQTPQSFAELRALNIPSAQIQAPQINAPQIATPAAPQVPQVSPQTGMLRQTAAGIQSPQFTQPDFFQNLIERAFAAGGGLQTPQAQFAAPPLAAQQVTAPPNPQAPQATQPNFFNDLLNRSMGAGQGIAAPSANTPRLTGLPQVAAPQGPQAVQAMQPGFFGDLLSRSMGAGQGIAAPATSAPQLMGLPQISAQQPMVPGQINAPQLFTPNAQAASFGVPQVPGIPAIQNNLGQTINHQLTTGGLTPEFIESQRRLVLAPQIEAMQGRLNRQGGGVALPQSGLFQELLRRTERDFSDQLLGLGFQGQQAAIGQGMGLGQQEFGQGLAGQGLLQQALQQQAALQQQTNLANQQASLATQGLGAPLTLQAQLANQGAGQRASEFGAQMGLQAQLANLGAAQQQQQLGFSGGLQTNLANQQAQLAAQQLATQAGLQGLGLGQGLLENDISRQLQNAQLALQSGQFNAGQGLQAQLANLGAAQQQQQLGFGGELQTNLANQQSQMAAQQLATQAGLQGLGLGQGLLDRDIARQLQNAQLALQAGQFGAGQGLQAQLANQSANLQAGQFSGQQAAQQALANQQALQNTQQLGVQAGMQGLGMLPGLASQELARQQAQAQMGLQGTGLQADIFGRAAGLDLQTALANQAAMQQGGQFGAEQALRAALSNQQTGLAAQQLGAPLSLQAQQLQAQLGLQGTGMKQDALSRLAQLETSIAEQQPQLGLEALRLSSGLLGQQAGLEANLLGQTAPELQLRAALANQQVQQGGSQFDIQQALARQGLGGQLQGQLFGQGVQQAALQGDFGQRGIANALAAFQGLPAAISPFLQQAQRVGEFGEQAFQNRRQLELAALQQAADVGRFGESAFQGRRGLDLQALQQAMQFGQYGEQAFGQRRQLELEAMRQAANLGQFGEQAFQGRRQADLEALRQAAQVGQFGEQAAQNRNNLTLNALQQALATSQLGEQSFVQRRGLELDAIARQQAQQQQLADFFRNNIAQALQYQQMQQTTGLQASDIVASLVRAALQGQQAKDVAGQTAQGNLIAAIIGAVPAFISAIRRP